MLAPYTKQYIRFARVEETGRTLVYAILLENNGKQEVALSEPKLIRIIVKAIPATALPVGKNASPFVQQLFVSPFAQSFIAQYSIPHFSYARPPTQ